MPCAVANFLDEWADHGFIMLPIVDGKTLRAKQAAISHITKRELSRGKAMEKRHQLRANTKRLGEEPLLEEERKELAQDCITLGKQVRTAETQTVKIVPKNVAGVLGQALDSISVQDTSRRGGFYKCRRQSSKRTVY